MEKLKQRKFNIKSFFKRLPCELTNCCRMASKVYTISTGFNMVWGKTRVRLNEKKMHEFFP